LDVSPAGGTPERAPNPILHGRYTAEALDSVLIKGFPWRTRADSLLEVGGEDGAVRLE
jgi:hypothetical protein